MRQRSPFRPYRRVPWLLVGLLACAGCRTAPALNTPGEADYMQGSRDLTAGKLPEAIAAFDKALATNPKHVEAAYYRAVARERQGETPEAGIADFTAVLALQQEIAREHDPNSARLDAEMPRLYCDRGNLYNKVGRYDAAIDDFSAAVRLDPKFAAAYRGRGIAFMGKGFPNLAIDNLSRAIQLDPDDVAAHCERARAYLAIGHHGLEASDDSVRALRADPHSAAAFYELGEAYAVSSYPNFAEAVNAYRQAIQLQPALAAEANPRIAAAYWNWSVALRKTGQANEAREKIEQAAALDKAYLNHTAEVAVETPPRAAGPREYVVNMPIAAAAETTGATSARLDQQGDDLLKQGQLDRAIETFTRTLQSDPDDYRALSGRGRAYIEKGFPDTALADLTTAIGMNKNGAAAYCERSLANSMLGDYFQAVEDATEAIRLQPDMARAYYYRAIAYLGRNNYQLALKDLALALRLDPAPAEHPRAMLAQGFQKQTVRYLQNDQWSGAIDGLVAAIRLAPGWRNWLVPQLAQAYRGRGLTRANARENSLAIRDFTAAAELTPDVAKNYQARGLTYYSLGDWNHAVEDFRRAIRLDPDMAYELRRPLADALRFQAVPVVPAKGRTEAAR